MADGPTTIDLSRADLRTVAGSAAACARTTLAAFEDARPDDGRPRTAIEVAQAFADSGQLDADLR